MLFVIAVDNKLFDNWSEEWNNQIDVTTDITTKRVMMCFILSAIVSGTFALMSMTHFHVYNVFSTWSFISNVIVMGIFTNMNGGSLSWKYIFGWVSCLLWLLAVIVMYVGDYLAVKRKDEAEFERKEVFVFETFGEHVNEDENENDNEGVREDEEAEITSETLPKSHTNQAYNMLDHITFTKNDESEAHTKKLDDVIEIEKCGSQLGEHFQEVSNSSGL